MCQGQGDVFAFERIDVGVEVIIVGETGPEGVGFGGRTVIRFWGGAKEFCERVCGGGGHGGRRRRRSR